MRLLVIVCVLFAGIARAQSPGVFLSTYAAEDHALNADPDSAFWKDAPQITMDRVITGEPDIELKEMVRSRWTKDKLYFLFIGPYDTLDLQPNPDTVNETYKLWFHDVFEMDLGANFDNINLYGEFQMSPQGEFADLGIDATRPRPGWNDERFWNSGMKVKARIDKDKKISYGRCRSRLPRSISARPSRAISSGSTSIACTLCPMRRSATSSHGSLPAYGTLISQKSSAPSNLLTRTAKNKWEHRER